MSLLHPTPGEAIDRLTIVTLKIEAALKLGKSIETLNTERKELVSFISQMDSNEESMGLWKSLGEVNRFLWKCEDDIRSTKGALKLVTLAKQIAQLNDERNRLIREINLAYGLYTWEEKIYS